jgi:hypothetical protein
VVQALANPVHATLAAVVGQLESGQRWRSLQGMEVDTTLAGHLRRYSLVMQHALQRVQQFDAASSKDGGASNHGKARPSAGLHWLAQTFLQKVRLLLYPSTGMCFMANKTYPSLLGVLAQSWRSSTSVQVSCYALLCRTQRMIVVHGNPCLYDVIAAWPQVLPPLSSLVLNHRAGGEFVAPMARSLGTLVAAQVSRCYARVNCACILQGTGT